VCEGDGILLQEIVLRLLFQNNEILFKSIIIIYQLNKEGVAANSTTFRTTNPYMLGYLQLITSIIKGEGTRWRSWLRHCATSLKVAGSIPDCVSGIFH
jgi:hypothetical protein